MRTFIAIELSDDVKKELASIQEELKKTGADVKWVKIENIHLTLKFLGNVDDDKIENIKTLLDKIASGYEKFEATLFKIGAFPKLEYPRVIWVGMDKGCNLAKEIASKIEDECEHIGFAKENRPFSAHLTLGRVRSGKNKDALKKRLISMSIKPQSFIVDKIILFQSTLTPKGPIYTPLHSSILSLH
ncbi:MAG: RNA 2',3'-cyclic phosphodiesterase [Candidatus Omnitrophica bacterium]|nr:RNA 2',3'-cyclic phosphodiesterase [Candidatus Omnitrophota bacterium]